MTVGKTLVALLSLASATVVAAAVALGSGDATPRMVVAGVVLKPAQGSTAQGAAYFRQRGRALSGWVAVWNLEPGSMHAVHFHGPAGKCGTAAKPAVAAHTDLVADARGVAFASFRTVSDLQVIRRGFYYNVHAQASTATVNPEIACGDIVPPAR